MFTERGYVELLDAMSGYRFEPFGTTATEPHVLWRHDIDISPQRALRLARLEAERDLRATYFVHLHSPFYNALEAPVRDILRDIIDLGHDIGLHFEVAFYADLDEVGLGVRLDQERAQLRWLVRAPVRAFAFHNPTEGFDAPMYAGLVNASRLPGYEYVSDSNGFWRYGTPLDLEGPRLQVLTHPEWWTPEPLSPRARVQRAIDGRAVATGRWYDDLLAAAGRENVA